MLYLGTKGKTMKYLLPILLIFSCQAFSQNIIRGKTIQSISIEKIPSFFFKVSAGGQYLSYTYPQDIARPGSRGNNFLLNTRTRVITKIPGIWDPVFVANSGLMILPIEPENYSIFSMGQLLPNNSHVLLNQPTFHIPNFKGFYQSAAKLPEANNTGETCYRVIAELRTGIHNLYDFCHGNILIYPLGVYEKTPVQPFCVQEKIKLPMLSKDGQFVGGVDLKTNTTSIFKISPEGECEKVHDLGIKTGKINFSFDGNFITYHLSRKKNAQTSAEDLLNYIAIPKTDHISDIFVYHLESKQIYRISENSKINSMYPDFLMNGNIVFINHPNDRKAKVSFTFLSLEGQGIYQ
jgi:hypothetical protein